MQINAAITGGDTIRQLLIDTQSQVPFATALALTRTGQLIKRAITQEMVKVFDRPTPYAVNSLKLTPATKQTLQAVVWFREFGGTPAENYLGPQVYGGHRKLKRFEHRLRLAGYLPSNQYVVPGNAASLNSYGNMSPAQIVQILSALGAQRDVYQNTRKPGTTKGGQTFFLSRNGKGIMRRGAGYVMFFVNDSMMYRKRLDFFGIAKNVFWKNYETEFYKAIDFSNKTKR